MQTPTPTLYSDAAALSRAAGTLVPYSAADLSHALGQAARAAAHRYLLERAPARYPRAAAAELRGRLAEARAACSIDGRSMPSILSAGSHKVESTPLRKGSRLAIAYLSPAESIGPEMVALGYELRVSLCRFSSASCRAACLGEWSGMMPMQGPTRARRDRTLALLLRPEEFGIVLGAELARVVRAAERAGGLAYVRLDGSTDLGLASMIRHHIASEDLGALRSLRFYDYTKGPARAVARDGVRRAFSAQRATTARAREILARGGTISAVFNTPKGAELPPLFLGFPVVDGDAIGESWAWDPDTLGKVVGLRFKQSRGRAESLERSIRGGFVFRAAEETT